MHQHRYPALTGQILDLRTVPLQVRHTHFVELDAERA
jgi:hypothetical protein